MVGRIVTSMERRRARSTSAGERVALSTSAQMQAMPAVTLERSRIMRAPLCSRGSQGNVMWSCWTVGSGRDQVLVILAKKSEGSRQSFRRRGL